MLIDDLTSYLEDKRSEYGNLEVVVFLGDGEWLQDINELSVTCADSSTGEDSQIWIEI